MDVKKVKELVELMKANDLSELEVSDGATKIMLKRGPDTTQIMMTPSAPVVPAVVQAPAAVPSEATADAADPSVDSHLQEITSPIVGTFYAAPSPNADAFIKVGDSVKKEAVVCIVEAMKVMNEIKTEIAGTIKQILVENGSAVEFGQPLFLVDPD